MSDLYTFYLFLVFYKINEKIIYINIYVSNYINVNLIYKLIWDNIS
jgi:hypothetical protein